MDVAIVLPYLTHPLARVRKAAIKAVGKLDGEQQIETLLRALADERPSVAHEAREALRGHLSSVEADKLWQMFHANTLQHVRLDLLSLLAGLPKWESISYLLEASSEEDTIIQERASKYIGAWLSGYNQSFAKPSTSQLARLKEALKSKPMLSLESIVRDGEQRVGWNG